ncbi:MAG: nucleotide exchange factor GrpE [Candidatus Zambryskibacteria bacterium RIFCSPHIGHO2_01_FULL_49_18]|uniref:Protein GrpE n=2 Tax=Candidatus Zambryskiibacteriota TaxID=1817925 RepID=A0A1G2T3H6_9BACT|nr:MAG: nucleotide exchange factor GrpE [Candidatus Zambryskibacteria bacterium RIFCSPHIGHO2_01_FULL_49_18]OHB05010.1 MAG: nucleotide exchange factor GrpE [Candidatus Zambryskibacteria bacterium RIFCSPLOWO2_01_FULL_47_14]
MDEQEKDFELSQDDVDDSVVEEEHMSEKVKNLKEKLKEAEGKAKEYLDGWQRAQADFVNIRKRDEEVRKEFAKFVSLEVIEDLIPVLDALTLGKNEQIYRLMMQILGKRGLVESDPIGEQFNPEFHEAIGMIKTDKKEDNHKILEVAQKGYILHGKIIRPAKVRIGEWTDN